MRATATKATEPARSLAKRTPAAPASKVTPWSAAEVIPVFRCACGGGCPRCTADEEPLKVRPKLAISRPGDRWEREADRVAEDVMRMSVMPSSTAGTPGTVESLRGKEALQRKSAEGSRSAVLSSPGHMPGVLLSPGRPLDGQTRSLMEAVLGYDLAPVRVHADAGAAASTRAVNALAYTAGHHIVFAEGQYRPTSGEGRKLLAHELAHVIQQRAGPDSGHRDTEPSPHGGGLTPTNGLLIQRALSCAIDHVKDECDNAGATCQTVQDKYCKKKYPKASDIDTLHSNAVTGAEGKKRSIPHAAENLLHFLGATGSVKAMPVDIFKNHKATKDQLRDVHRERFKEGAEKRLKDGRLAAGGSAEMVWTDTANAFSFVGEDDLGLAVGGYTLCSKVKVSATAQSGGDIEVSFDTWTVEAFDCYNWDPGKGIGGLFGGVSDNDLCCMENAGKGQHFRIRTDPWINTYASASFIISPAAPASKPKPKLPPKPDDDR